MTAGIKPISVILGVIWQAANIDSVLNGRRQEAMLLLSFTGGKLTAIQDLPVFDRHPLFPLDISTSMVK